MARGDPINPFPRALRHVDQPLAARNMDVRRLAAPAREKLGVLLFDFVERQPLQRAVIEFANGFLDLHRQAVRLTDQLGGLARPAQIAGVNRLDVLAAEQRGDLFGLPHSDIAEFQVGGALTAPL